MGRSFDESTWGGAFDTNDDVDSVWGFNTVKTKVNSNFLKHLWSHLYEFSVHSFCFEDFGLIYQAFSLTNTFTLHVYNTLILPYDRQCEILVLNIIANLNICLG